MPIAGLGILVGLACLVMAWRTRDADRAMLAHGVALASTVGLITASASIAINRGKMRSRGGSRRLPRTVARALLFLLLAVVLGLVALVVR